MSVPVSVAHILTAEITGDPAGLGYAGKTAAQITDILNNPVRDEWLPLSSAQIFEAIVAAEFAGLLPAEQARVDRILGLGEGIETGPGSKARAELAAVFGGGSATAAALIAAARRKISRAHELRLGEIPVGWVMEVTGGN